jgi:N12 class adenine-specific DNA methylase
VSTHVSSAEEGLLVSLNQRGTVDVPLIDANLGAPWIPAEDIQAFAAELFHVEPASVCVANRAAFFVPIRIALISPAHGSLRPQTNQ